jgi:hypothetical protein
MLKIITLTRKDLRFVDRNLPINEIRLHSFDEKLLSINDINRADKIIYKENNTEVVLKNRFESLALGEFTTITGTYKK